MIMIKIDVLNAWMEKVGEIRERKGMENVIFVEPLIMDVKISL